LSYQRHVEKRGANHTLHLILTICTCGIWAITGWPIAAILGRKKVTTTYTPPPPQYGQQPPPGQYPPRQ
jgi:hypothetical protein